MIKQSRIIAEHLMYKFLNDKFNYCGEPLTTDKIDYYEKSLSKHRLTWMVYMFTEKNGKYLDIRDEINLELETVCDEFIGKERAALR